MNNRIRKQAKSKINDAIELLREAARETEGALKDTVQARAKDIQAALNEAAEEGKEVFFRTKQKAEEAVEAGEEKIKETARTVNQKVHRNPWPYLGALMLVSFIVGYGMKRKRPIPQM